MREFYTNISGTKSPFSAAQGMQNLQAAPPTFSKNAAVQDSFADTYRPMAQQAAMELSRANTGQAADYRQKATQAQNNAVLSGLAALNTQEQNANARSQAMQKMAYDWMGNMFNGGMLGGLL